MSDDTEKTTSVVTDIMTRRPARPVPYGAIDRAMGRMEAMGVEPTRRQKERLNAEYGPMTPRNDLDLYVDDLERRLEVAEGKAHAALIVVALAVVAVLVNIFVF